MASPHSTLGHILILLLLAQIGSCFIYTAGLSSLEKRMESSLKRPSRYWNDDLYPCIEKYCGQYVNSNTNMYVRCLSKFCQRGVLTVPARDLHEHDLDSSDILMPSSMETDVGDNSAIRDEVFTLIAYCHRMLCPLDHDQDFSVFWECAEDKCVPWFESAWQQQSADQRRSDEKIAMLKGAIDNLNKKNGKSIKEHRQIRSSTDDDADELQDGDHSGKARGDCTQSTLGEPGCDWKTLYAKKNAPLARKRRINDDVSQCIQSYCGGKDDLNQRMFCVIKHCHRIRSFN